MADFLFQVEEGFAENSLARFMGDVCCKSGRLSCRGADSKIEDLRAGVFCRRVSKRIDGCRKCFCNNRWKKAIT